MTVATVDDIQRVCVKIYAPEPDFDDQLYVPIFHDWVRERVFEDLILFDVADYAHVPESPGIVLVAHEAHFALDRSDGRFGLLIQRRVSGAGDSVESLAGLIRHGLEVARRLEQDPRVEGKIAFDTSTLRIEANDRLRTPNTDDGYRVFGPIVRAAVERAFGGGQITLARVANDARDRLAAEVRITASAAC